MTALHRPNSRLTQLQKYPVRLVEGAIEDVSSSSVSCPRIWMPFSTLLATPANGRATSNGNGKPMWKARTTWWRRPFRQAKQKIYSYIDEWRLRHSNRTLRRDRAKARKGRLQLSALQGHVGGGSLRGIARGLDAVLLNPANVMAVTRAELLVKVHPPGGEPATAANSTGKAPAFAMLGGARAS